MHYTSAATKSTLPDVEGFFKGVEAVNVTEKAKFVEFEGGWEERDGTKVFSF